MRNILLPYSLVAGMLLSTQLMAQSMSVHCKKMNIYANGGNNDYIRITSLENNEARFQVCDYQNPNICHRLGHSEKYKMNHLGFKKISQYLKGTTALVIEAEIITGLSILAGMVGTVMASESTVIASEVVSLEVGGNTMALGAAGISAFIINKSKALNPLEHFRNGVAINDLKEALEKGSCAISLELDEKEMIERMESVVDNLESVK